MNVDEIPAMKRARVRGVPGTRLADL